MTISSILALFKDAIKSLKHFSMLQKNRTLEDLHAGQKVIIVGNGPSLKNISNEILLSHNLIVMNHFELHPLAKQCRVVAHCIGEPFYSATWEDPINMIEGTEADLYLFRYDASYYFKQRNVCKNIYYYLPCNSDRKRQPINLTQPSLHYQSTSQMAIALAIYMGFKDIYLAGFDHDWLCTRGISPHFYHERDGVAKSDLSIFTYHQMIKISLNLFDKYEEIKRIAHAKNLNIYNLYSKSYLDTFPYIELSGNFKREQ